MKDKFLRTLACLMAVVMLLSVAPLGSLAGVDFGMTASAASAKSGKCGKNVTWTLDSKGVLTISGKGKMYDYSFDYSSPFRANELITSIVIKNGVTSIGDHAFSSCRNLTGAIIPNSVTSIGNDAFYYGLNLTNIKIPNSVTHIGDGAFAQSNLESVNIPDGVVDIGEYAFGSCVNLTRATISNSVKSIGSRAFEYCPKLKSIAIPNGVKSIGDGAFDSCSSLTTVKISDSVTSIEANTFRACESLTNVIIPKGVISIGYCAFGSCYGLKSLTIPDGVKSIGEGAFSYCRSLTAVKISNSVMSIDKDAFSDCDSLKSVTIPKSVKNIGEHAFGYEYQVYQAEKIDGFTIKGYASTAAEKYAKDNGFKFVKLTTEPISDSTISVATSATYTGKALIPKITVKNGKITLKSGTHYTVSYKNNTKVGKATVTIKGVEKNGYTGTKTLTFNILPGVTKSLKATQSTSSIKLTWSKVAGATGYRVYRHDGKKWVKLADTKNTTYTVSKLKAGTNYKYAIKAYTTVGKTVYWSASFAQISTATKPATPAIKVTAGKKQAAVSWKKITGATGYVVYYSTSKNGEYRKLATVKGTSYTAKKLATGKTYYFKVAAYKTVGKTNIYGSYSTATGAKIK